MAKCTGVKVAVQTGTERTMYATWEFHDSYTHFDHYQIMWKYATGDGVGFIGSDGETYDRYVKQSLYTPPDNATHVTFKVKPVSKTDKQAFSNKETYYWDGEWSTEVRYNFADEPKTPPTPDVEIDKFMLTARVDNLDINADSVEFRVVKNDKTTVSRGTASIVTTTATYSCTVDAGGEYKVACRGIKNGVYGEWSDFSNNQGTIPSAPDEILELRAKSSTHVYIDWSEVENAESYEIEYAKGKNRFDSSTETQTMTVEAIVSHAEVTGLETGEQWFFRVRAVNDQGASAWTPVKSIKMGTAPNAPTTWSSTTTAIVGSALNLYWVHNTEDGSRQTFAELEITVDDVTTTYTIESPEVENEDEEEERTSVYTVDTSGYIEGTQILWRVRTRGITDEYSEWSIQRTVDIYAPPVLELIVTTPEGREFDTLESLPFDISANARPNTQTPIGFHVSIIANETYETTDNVGNDIIIGSGDEIFSEYFDSPSEPTEKTLFYVDENDVEQSALQSFQFNRRISAGDIRLDNNISYTIKCTVSMNSGLTADAQTQFTVGWDDDERFVDLEFGYDKDRYCMYMRPYCTDINANEVTDVLLAVYRREYNGKFTEIASNIDPSLKVFVMDPHPSLDYARYRIVATDNNTSKVSYHDVTGYHIGEKAIIIQWDESWSYFDTSEEAAREEPLWSGSLLRLPYNIEVSDSYDVDVERVEYVGREHPVSYYGTQLGETSTWNVSIDKKDVDTLYALRRLAIWTGDVYVREPSGSGYWANISVSFSQRYNDLVIPVSLNVVRVTGGA